MSHLKQRVFRSALHGSTCIYCGFEEGHLPCDHALKSAPNYLDRYDPRRQAEETDNAHS